MVLTEQMAQDMTEGVDHMPAADLVIAVPRSVAFGVAGAAIGVAATIVTQNVMRRVEAWEAKQREQEEAEAKAKSKNGVITATG